MKKPQDQIVMPEMPGPQQAHIWLLDLSCHDPENYAEDCFVLDDNEEKRAMSFRRECDRQQYRLSRTAVRNVLSSYYPAVSPAHWRFTRSLHGKPAIAGPELTEPLYFNISHSGAWLAIAVAQNEGVGIDVEQVSVRRSALAIARRYFTEQEFSELCDLAPESRIGRFYELWTLKEAYSKACGNALVPTLGELAIGFPAEQRIAASLLSPHDNTQDLLGWELRLFDLKGYQLALALRTDRTTGDTTTSAWQIDDPLMPGAATVIDLLPARRNR